MTNSPATILIVDDQPQNTSALAKLLEADGYDVLIADNGLMALHMLGERNIDLVLLDVQMPGMDGYEVLGRIRAMPRLEKLPVLLVSARYTEAGDAARGLQIGADDYIAKPADLDEMKARIASKLRQRRLEFELREAHVEAQAQSELLRRALDVVQAAAMSLDPDSLAMSLTRGMHSDLGVDRVVIWREHPSGHPYSTPVDAPPLPEGAWHALSGGSEFVREPGRMLMPMRIAGDLKGVLDIKYTSGEWRPEATVTILQALADSLAILFQNTMYMRQIARENQFHTLLNDLASQDASLPKILLELRQFLNTTLLLVDRWLNVMEGEAIPTMVENGQLRHVIMRHYQSQKIIEQIVRHRRPLVVETRGEIPYHRIFPVVLGGEVSALLMTVPTPGTVLATLAPEKELEQAARFLAGVLQRHREATLREQNLRADFLNDFLSGRLTDEISRPALFLRANALGLNLAHSGFVAQVDLPNFDQLVDWTQPLFERRVSEVLAPLLYDVQRARSLLNLDGIEVTMGERVIVVISLPTQITEEQARQKAMRWAEQVLELFERHSPSDTIRPAIGLGRLATRWQELPRSANEADRALRWVLSNSRTNISYYGDLGSERLLAAVNDRKELERFCSEQLDAVISYDEAKEGELVRTLEGFFANGGHMARAAQMLAVHPNTLKYRLDQVTQLTGRDPRDPAVALDLQLALKIYHMF